MWYNYYMDKIKQKTIMARYYIRRKSHPSYQCIDCGIGVSGKNRRCNPCAHQFKRSEYGKSLGKNRSKNVHGYIMCKVNGKYIQESRYIWEQYYKKPIPKGWQVHHLDGDKTNNDIKNLYACSKYNHMSNHFLIILQDRIKGLQKEIKILKNHNPFLL